MAAPPGAIEARKIPEEMGTGSASPEQGKGQRGARCSPPRNCGFRLATRRVGVVPGHNSISDVTGLGPVVPVNNAGSRTVLGKLDPEPVDAVAGLACDKSVDPPIGVGKFARARVAAPESAGPATSAHLVWLRRSAPEIPVRVTVKPSTELAGAANPGSRNRFGRQSARAETAPPARADRKSTRLNSSHITISYAVFCLKKKKKKKNKLQNSKKH